MIGNDYEWELLGSDKVVFLHWIGVQFFTMYLRLHFHTLYVSFISAEKIMYMYIYIHRYLNNLIYIILYASIHL